MFHVIWPICFAKGRVLVFLALVMATEVKKEKVIENLFKAGAHFGLIRSRRHPSVKPFIFGVKNKIEIFDLEKTSDSLAVAKDFIKSIVAQGGQVLFVGGKNESIDAVRNGAIKAGMPYVAGRWLGGTLTNFPEIKKRITKLEDLTSQKEKGELGKYTKKERLLIDREIITLTHDFFGITTMRSIPKALFVIDLKKELIAVKEARRLKIPVVSLSSSDCNLREVEYPIPGNDASKASIGFFVDEIVSAIEDGKSEAALPKEETSTKKE
jgi:small subunit ribosomal protein S2